jgi:hypothetical protein
MTTHGSVAKSMRERIEKLTDERDALRIDLQTADDQLRALRVEVAKRVPQYEDVAALRAKCGELGDSVNIMGRAAVNLGQAKQIAESTLVELQRDDDHDQAFLHEEIIALRAEVERLKVMAAGLVYSGLQEKARAEKAEAALGRIDSRARIGQDSTPVAALAALASIRKTIAALRDTAPAEEWKP